MVRKKKIVETTVESLKPALPEQKSPWSFAYYLAAFATNQTLEAAKAAAAGLGLKIEELVFSEPLFEGGCRVLIKEIETAVSMFPGTRIIRHRMPGNWNIFEIFGEDGKRYSFRTDGMSQGIWFNLAEKKANQNKSAPE